MAIKSRLEKAEKVVNPNPSPTIHIWISGDGYHERHGSGGEVLERLNDAEWTERVKGERVITVTPDWEEEKIQLFEGSGINKVGHILPPIHR